MHTGVLKLVDTHNELLQVSTNIVAIFRDIKHRSKIHQKYTMNI